MKGNGTILMQHDLWWHGLAPFFGRVCRRGQYCTGQFHIVAADLFEKDRGGRGGRGGRSGNSFNITPKKQDDP